MVSVSLPISKSIANRRLILQALHGDPLMGVSDVSFPEDVRVMHNALRAIQTADGGTLALDTGNCGTAMRFLTAFCAQLSNRPMTFVLDGNERMRQRPIGQEVEMLRQAGADIGYLGEEGFPPLRIAGRKLKKQKIHTDGEPLQSSQFVSALLLIGIEVETDEQSPYISMTRRIIGRYGCSRSCDTIERDWSSAAFWYEWVALHGGEIFLEDLQPSVLQGDECVKDLFAPLGVKTAVVSEPQLKGVVLTRNRSVRLPDKYAVDFSACPDLYPAVALTCERLGVCLQAAGTERLGWKESDRLRSVGLHLTCHDHRMAMALMAADMDCDDKECIGKSYPVFLSQLQIVREQSESI